MKLLIVDDEQLTREGLISSIDWEALGISQIFQADDGYNGLHMALEEKPEIVLCDVRMPRLDGIRMMERLEERLPDTMVIFMSGYSDKEYLKAAIKLKAVNYVEKPLNPKEIREAVLEAKERCMQKSRTRRNEELHSLGTASSLALALTRPYEEQKDAINTMALELSMDINMNTAFTTYIVRLKTQKADMVSLNGLHESFSAFLKRYRQLQALYVFRQGRYHVFHLLGTETPSPVVLKETDQFLTEGCAPYGDFYIARGETVTGVAHACKSYASAAALIQSGFFFDSGYLLISETESPEMRDNSQPLPQTAPAVFQEQLEKKDLQACRELLDAVFHAYSHKRNVFPARAKDLYYKLFMALQESRQNCQLPAGGDMEAAPQSIMGFLENCFTLRELHAALQSSLEGYFEALQSHVPEDSTVFLIKDFIAQNYANETLSVREISEHVFLSASYVCTYFKNQTGQTLNQYLTAYRIEKAKQLLRDPRYQITDVSSKVGYSNGNYFSKSFKKMVGLSPSEYREKMMQ